MLVANVATADVESSDVIILVVLLPAHQNEATVGNKTNEAVDAIATVSTSAVGEGLSRYATQPSLLETF